MTASAENSLERRHAPIFLILTDLRPPDLAWPAAAAQIEDVRASCEPVLGFDPEIRLTNINDFSAFPGSETFVIPAALDFSLWERDALGQRIAEQRRNHPDTLIYHDDVDPGHSL